MKAAFLKSMRYLYPDGPGSAQQHRDLVKCYSMGWCDSLVADGNSEAVDAWTREFKFLADLNWWPDASWKWW